MFGGYYFIFLFPVDTFQATYLLGKGMPYCPGVCFSLVAVLISYACETVIVVFPYCNFFIFSPFQKVFIGVATI